jgi:hypothetical protein
LWETPAGEAWLQTLFFATLYVFGLQGHVGADRLEEFFRLLRLETHIGISATTLRRRLNQMEALLPQFQAQCEQQAGDSTRPGVVAADETFQGKLLILVLMELRSGYLVLEDMADDRKFDTWQAVIEPRLKTLGLKVEHAVTDRARALIKLAKTGFKCGSGADLFHAQYDCSSWLGAKLARLQKKAATGLQQALAARQQASPATDTETLVALVDAERAHKAIQATGTEYHEQLAGIAQDVHPFSLDESQPKTAADVSSALETRAKAFEVIAKSAGITDWKGTLNKFRGQFDALALHVTFWWQFVLHSLANAGCDPAMRDWLTCRLLPVVYWHEQMQKTKNRRQREVYRRAWQQAVAALNSDEQTANGCSTDLERWVTWAERMARNFHRSSSAVEGRNGYLSQMYHNGRGLTASRLRALTVIQNYGVRRADGTTAARRLFDREFPDLFSWLVDQMGELPLPRQRKKSAVRNPLGLAAVPS